MALALGVLMKLMAMTCLKLWRDIYGRDVLYVTQQ